MCVRVCVRVCVRACIYIYIYIYITTVPFRPVRRYRFSLLSLSVVPHQCSADEQDESN